MVGLMGWFVPQALGVGYSYVGIALDGKLALKPDGAACCVEALLP